MNVLAGHHFTLGQRAFFFSVGFLGLVRERLALPAGHARRRHRALPAAVRLPEAGVVRVQAERERPICSSIFEGRVPLYS